MTARARIAWNLRRIRTARQISQEHLAVDANVDRTYVSGIEREEFNPAVDILDRIARALDIDISELFARIDPDEIAPSTLKRGRRKGSEK